MQLRNSPLLVRRLKKISPVLESAKYSSIRVVFSWYQWKTRARCLFAMTWPKQSESQQKKFKAGTAYEPVGFEPKWRDEKLFIFKSSERVLQISHH